MVNYVIITPHPLASWICVPASVWHKILLKASAGYRTALAFNKILCQALAGTHIRDASGWGVIISQKAYIIERHASDDCLRDKIFCPFTMYAP